MDLSSIQIDRLIPGNFSSISYAYENYSYQISFIITFYAKELCFSTHHLKDNCLKSFRPETHYASNSVKQ